MNEEKLWAPPVRKSWVWWAAQWLFLGAAESANGPQMCCQWGWEKGQRRRKKRVLEEITARSAVLLRSPRVCSEHGAEMVLDFRGPRLFWVTDSDLFFFFF